MFDRPPLPPFWKGVSKMIVVTLLIVLGIFLIFFFKDKADTMNLKNTHGEGIIIEKKDLRRGDFLLVIKGVNEKKEYILSVYDKFFIGDLIVKPLHTFQFDVYRKDSNGKYGYVNIIDCK